MNDRYKIYSLDGRKSFELYDWVKDSIEVQDLSNKMPDKVEKIKNEFKIWLHSLQKSQKREMIIKIKNSGVGTDIWRIKGSRRQQA